MDSRITTGDRVSDNSRHHIEWDIIDTKTPHKVVNVADVFLVGLRGEQRLKQPLAIMELSNMAHLAELFDALSHDNGLILPI